MSSVPSRLPPSARCPLCGQANQCAIAQGQPAHQCWCMQAMIDARALQQVPEAARGKVCICPACGARGTAPSGGAHANSGEAPI